MCIRDRPNSASDLQLQLRRLELEAEKEKRAYELEAAERQNRMELAAEEKKLELEEKKLEAEKNKRAHELEMKRLELAAQSGTASADVRPQAPAFCIDTAVKLIPKFNQHDVESFFAFLREDSSA